jgi:hypothetical protein
MSRYLFCVRLKQLVVWLNQTSFLMSDAGCCAVGKLRCDDRDLNKVLRVQTTSSIGKSNDIASKIPWFITKSLLHQAMDISLREYCERIVVVGVGRLVGDVCSLDDSIETVHIIGSVCHTSETSVSLLKTILPGNNSIFQPLLLLLNIASLE